MGGAHTHHDVDLWWDEAPPPDPARAVRRDRWIGLALLVVAFVVFEWTANPALTTAVGCLKFGWDEFRISRYLKAHDPDRTRGRVLSRFYLAAALWRVSLVAMSMPCALVLIASVVHLGGNGPGAAARIPPAVDAALMGAVFTALGGFILSALVVGVATGGAVIHRVPVWVGRAARRAYRAGTWPPVSDPHRAKPTNWAGLLILTSMMSLASFLVLVFYIAFPFFPPFLFLIPFGIPVVMLVWLDHGGRRIFAVSPEACWGPVREVDHARA